MRSLGKSSHAKADSSMNVEEVSSVEVDTAFHLHRDLGPGLLESVYEVVLARICGWNVNCLLPF